MSVGNSQKSMGTNEESQTSVEDCIISHKSFFITKQRCHYWARHKGNLSYSRQFTRDSTFISKTFLWPMSSFHARWCLCWIFLTPKPQIPPAFHYRWFQHTHLLQSRQFLLSQSEQNPSALSCKWTLPSCVCQEWYLLCWLKALLKIVPLFGKTDLKQNMNLTISPSASLQVVLREAKSLRILACQNQHE